MTLFKYRSGCFKGSFLPTLPGPAVCVGEKIQSLLFMLQAQFLKGSSDSWKAPTATFVDKNQWRCRMPMTVDHFWFDHFLVFHHPAFEATDNGQGVGVQQGGIPDFPYGFLRNSLRFPNRRGGVPSCPSPGHPSLRKAALVQGNH